MNSTAINVTDPGIATSIATVQANGWHVRERLIPRLIESPDQITELSAEEFEELILDRFLAMGAQAFRIGAANKKDGGIDIVFWTNSFFPFVGAVQVRHRKTKDGKVGTSDVRELIGSINGKRFNMGIIVTNGRFTKDAKAHAIKSTAPVQLRDHESVMRWIIDDFSVESLELKMRLVEFCTNVEINLPHFG
jgi:restriction endonuclease Mrr